MAELDTEDMLEKATLLGLTTQEQYREARAEAANGSAEAILRVLVRKGKLTSWQLEKLRKGNPSGFFFGEYKVLFHLAEGTFARVYRGEHLASGSAVAIKVLRQRFASIPEAVRRFHQEAEAGMRLRHPNIVRILDEGQQDQSHFMIMEYVEGSNLKDFLKKRHWLPPETAVPLMLGMAEGLKYSHDEGVTHRDIKKTNILISNSGEAKLVDFGLATIESAEQKKGVHSQRTVDYSALERTCGSPKGDIRSDIYFLGLVFYELLTGVSPLPEAESKDILEKMLKRPFNSIKRIEELRHAPDEALCKIIDKMMKMDLKARYQSMQGVVSDLTDYLHKDDSPVLNDSELVEIDFEQEIRSALALRSTTPETPAAATSETAQFADHEEAADHSGGEFRPPEFEIKAIHQKQILCVESQSEVQDAFRKTLSQMGFRALIVGDPERAAERFAESEIDGVIFDCDGFGSESIEALSEMHESAHESDRPLIGVVVLGPKQRDLIDSIPTDDRLIVLVKPIKMKQVQQAITELIPDPHR